MSSLARVLMMRAGLLAAALVAVGLSGAASAVEYTKALDQLGRVATAEEVKAWDIDVRPDFTGLPAGSGSVMDGEELWLEKCAVCHGDFGDSNEVFSPLALGNVTPEDMDSGRVEALTGNATRTTLMKVATLSTIWDYINRAMPWNAPKSLETDEVYALTAYLLSLGYIVDEDFVLSNENIEEVQAMMPNRNGMTTDHGLWSVDGTPDVMGSTCTKNCDVDTTVSSFIPAYAMNAHGNLRDQVRDYGPFPGIQTAPESENEAAMTPEEESGAVPNALLAGNGCLGCHQVEKGLIGPAFKDVMAKYAGTEDATAYLLGKIRGGGSGIWGSGVMPPMPQVDEETATTIARWLAGE